MLETWNYLVVEARNGAEAVSLAENVQPDLILLDVRMPDFDGFETARMIRESEKTSDSVPIIFLSDCAEASYRDQTQEAGGNEYLVKPLDFEALEKTLGKYARRFRKCSAAKAEAR